MGVTRPVTLQLGIPLALSGQTLAHGAVEGLSQLTPPAAFYGAISGPSRAAFAAGATITAWIGANACGQGVITRAGDGETRYRVKVRAASAELPGCGVPGQAVIFKVGNVTLAQTGRWDNRRPQALALSAP